MTPTVKPEDSRERYRLLERKISQSAARMIRRSVLGQAITIRASALERRQGFYLDAETQMFSHGIFETPELAAMYLAKYGIVADQPVTLAAMTAPEPSERKRS